MFQFLDPRLRFGEIIGQTIGARLLRGSCIERLVALRLQHRDRTLQKLRVRLLRQKI